MDREKLNRYLAQWNQGNDEALGPIFELAKDDLLRRAKQQVQSTSIMIEPRVLFGEAYQRIRGFKKRGFDDIDVFLNFLEKQMKLARIDILRRETAQKRGDGSDHLPLENFADRD